MASPHRFFGRGIQLKTRYSGILFATLLASQSFAAVKIAYVGDQGLGENAKKVMELVKKEKADLVVIVGDFDYRNKPKKWKELLDDKLGNDFPVLGVAGNHDADEWDAYQKILQDRGSQTKDLTCTGATGLKASCSFRGVRFLISSVGVFGTGHGEYLRKELKVAPETWKVCLWHMNQRLLQVEAKRDETGWDVYEACRQGGAMIVNGHAHLYARTHLLSSVNPPTVSSAAGEIHLLPDTTVVAVSGLGGKSIRRRNRTLAEKPWWASVFSSAEGADYGALFCSYDSEKKPPRAECYFKDISSRIPDRFTLIGPP